MGLFGKKDKIPDGIRVMYYEGELNEFQCNYPVQLLLMEDALRITKINPYVEVRLDRTRILSIDILTEIEYMAKYKGTSATTSKAKNISKIYFIFNYIDKNGENKHLDFWGTNIDTSKIVKMREELVKDKSSKKYEI